MGRGNIHARNLGLVLAAIYFAAKMRSISDERCRAIKMYCAGYAALVRCFVVKLGVKWASECLRRSLFAME